MARDQVEGLEHDADVAAAEQRQRVLVEPGQRPPGELQAAGGRPFQPGEQHQQAGLAGAGRSDQPHGFARRQVEIDAAENIDRPGRRGQGQAQAPGTQKRRAGGP